MKIIALLVLLSLTIIAGCDTTPEPKPEPKPVDTLSEPKPDKVATEWTPRQQPEGQLKVEVTPASAKVDIVSLGEENGMIPVKIKVESIGLENGRPRIKGDQNVNITLTQANFLSQQYTIYPAMKEGTATLLRMSFEKDRREESFRRASDLYGLVLAYPTYIPAGFTLETAVYHHDIFKEPAPSDSISLIWTKGNQRISMLFMPKGTSSGIVPNGKVSHVTIDKSLKVLLISKDNHDFLWSDSGFIFKMEMQELPKKETRKVIEGIRLLK